MVFTKETWAKIGAGYSIYDCAIRSRTRQCFLMYEKQASPHRDPLPRIQFLFTYTDEVDPEERYFFKSFGNFSFARIAYSDFPIPNYVAVDSRTQVFSYDKDRDGEEPRHPWEIEGSDISAVVTQVMRIGKSTFSVGGPRRMHRRTSVGNWTDMTHMIPVAPAYAKGDETMADYIWNDASGFDERDIYAAGGAGDVWHFNGSQWTQCSFPSNERLNNVHCGIDGNVYIGGNMGSLYMGRQSKWKKLGGSDFSVPWKDIAFFAGRLWCGSDYGLWELRDGKLVRADVPADVQLVSGAIDISPDGKLMLTAGPDGAALFDGQRWEVLFSRHDLE